MYRCPLCGDWHETRDWCNHCEIPMKFEPLRGSEPGPEQQYQEYYEQEYALYVERCLQEYVQANAACT